MANIKDFAAGLVLTAPSPATSGTSVTLRSGEGAYMPAVPFYATICPPGQLTTLGNSEKVLVTARPGNADTFTINRAQSPTTAKTVAAGWAFVNAVYSNDLFNSAFVFNEVPSGTVNSSNTVFTLASTPTGGNVKVHVNGLRQKVGDDYTVAGNTVTFTTAPPTGSNVLVDYMVGSQANTVGTNSYIAKEAVTGSVNSSNTVFTTARAYIGGSLEVYVNGLKQGTAHITETNPSAGTFTADVAPVTGDIVEVAYQYNLNPSSNADTVDGINASTTPTANQLYPLNSNLVYPQTVIETTTLGYAQTTTAQGGIVADNLTGLSVTVTVPAGGRRVKITGYAGWLTNTANNYVEMYIREGATTLQTAHVPLTATTQRGTAMPIAIITPSAGSHTYNLFAALYGGAGQTLSSVTNPSYILVELI